MTTTNQAIIITRRAQGASLGQLAKEFGCTRERVRQITGERPVKKPFWAGHPIDDDVGMKENFCPHCGEYKTDCEC